MKFILLSFLMLSSSAFSQTIKMKIGSGYIKADGDYIQIYSPDLKNMEIDCTTSLGVMESIQSTMASATVTTNIFAVNTGELCLIMLSYSINDGVSRSLGQLNIPFSGNINTTIFNGTSLELEDGYTYTPTIGISPL